MSRDALWGGHHGACPPGVGAEPPGAGCCGSATVRGGWPKLAWRSGSLCGPLVGVPHAAMPKARASALGLPAVRLAQEVPSAAKQRASAGHASEDGDPGAAQAGGAQTAAPASAEWCWPPHGAGRAVGCLVHVCGAPRPGHSGEGLAGRQLDTKCFSDAVRWRGAQAPGPRGRAGSGPRRLHKPGHAAGTPWAAVSLHRTQQSHRQGFLGQETQLCRETDTLLTLLTSGSRQRGHEIAGSCARGPPGSGRPSCHQVSVLTRGSPEAVGPSGAGGGATSGRAGREVASVAIVIVPVTAVICRARGSNHEG